LSIIACVFASPFLLDRPTTRKSPRTSSLFPCDDFVCLGVGSQCSTNGSTPCDVCLTNYFTCTFAPGINSTGLCACYSTFASCTNGMGAYCSFTEYFTQQSCLTSGLTCCGTPPTTVPIAECPGNAFCNSNSGLCQLVSKTGPCTSDSQCGDPSQSTINLAGSGYVCNSGNCAYLPDFPPGVSCSANSDCASGICSGGVCSGIAVGSSCSDQNACVAGAYCDGTCKTLIPVGGDCSSVSPNEQSNACAFGSTCNGTCVKWASRSAGQPCSDSSECSTNVCFQSVCTTFPPVKTCTNDSDCNGDPRYQPTCLCVGSTYQCSSAIGTDIITPCQSTYNDAVNCVTSTGCDPRAIGINCCTSQYNCFVNCVYTEFFKEQGTFTCGGLPTCTHKSGAMTLQVGIIFTLLSILALFF